RWSAFRPRSWPRHPKHHITAVATTRAAAFLCREGTRYVKANVFGSRELRPERSLPLSWKRIFYLARAVEACSLCARLFNPLSAPWYFQRRLRVRICSLQAATTATE